MIDSGLDPGSPLVPSAYCRCSPDGRVSPSESRDRDVTGHGTRIATVIASAACPPDLLIAQVLDDRGAATAIAVAAAIDWAVASGVHLIHMSLGLRADRPSLAASVEAAIGRGTLVIASSPARGAPTYPACLPGVIAATGDARCAPGEISALHTAQAAYGGCVRLSSDDRAAGRGASIGAAHVTRTIIDHSNPGEAAPDVRARLDAIARYTGPERR